MPITSVDSATLKHWISSGEALVVDVREPDEYAVNRIEGATLVPLASVSKSALPHAPGKKLVIHCRSGKRSAEACKKLLAEDPNLDLYNLQGGIIAWNTAKTSLPLDRQVQLIVGLLILAGSTLGYCLSKPAWFFLTGFIGAGLIIAALTGFCTLAKIITQMPWNQKGVRS